MRFIKDDASGCGLSDEQINKVSYARPKMEKWCFLLRDPVSLFVKKSDVGLIIQYPAAGNIAGLQQQTYRIVHQAESTQCMRCLLLLHQ